MKKIVLIDDNKELRENTAEILELANYHVFTAENGRIGVELALQEDPDLIICDIMMPELDGFGVLSQLQKNPMTRHKPFIFLTAKTEHQDLRKGMELGADDYITKPFSGTELLSAVESRFKKNEGIADKFKAETQQLLKISNRDLLIELTEASTTNFYKKKQAIYSEGNRPISLYYIKSGKVKTFKTNNSGKELVIGLYNQNDYFGYVALLEQTNYLDTAIAMEDTELSEIPKNDFELLVQNNREVSRTFIQLLSNNISEKKEQLIGMAYNSLRKKVAEALITVYKKYHTRKNETFSISITRENLASIAGTATESLIRTLGDFKDENLITVNESLITIINPKKIENMIN